MLNFELEFEKATTRVAAHDLQCNIKIGFVVGEDDHVPKRYDVFNEKVEHVKGLELLIGQPQDRGKRNLNSRQVLFNLGRLMQKIFFLMSSFMIISITFNPIIGSG